MNYFHLGFAFRNILNTVFWIIYVSSKGMFAMTLKYMHKLLYKSYMRQHHFRDEMASQCNLQTPLSNQKTQKISCCACQLVTIYSDTLQGIRAHDRYKSSTPTFFSLPQQVANNVPRFLKEKRKKKKIRHHTLHSFWQHL